jgi:hypothetical protein
VSIDDSCHRSQELLSLFKDKYKLFYSLFRNISKGHVRGEDASKAPCLPWPIPLIFLITQTKTADSRVREWKWVLVMLFSCASMIT